MLELADKDIKIGLKVLYMFKKLRHKKDPNQNLEMITIVYKIGNILDGVTGRLNVETRKTSKLQDIATETIQNETQR